MSTRRCTYYFPTSYINYQNQKMKKAAGTTMEIQNGAATVTPSYEDFEPFCNWRRDDDNETLVFHLPAFRKEDLKVQLHNLKTLKISGERPLEGTKRSRFYREITVSKDCNAKEIHAKFVSGLLYIVMPKKGSLAPKQEILAPQSAVDEKSTPEINSKDDQVSKSPTLTETGSAVEKIVPPNSTTMLSRTVAATSSEFCKLNSRLKSFPRMATNLAVVAVMMACLGAYIMYSYRTLSDEE